jgi:hypothetical protein
MRFEVLEIIDGTTPEETTEFMEEIKREITNYTPLKQKVKDLPLLHSNYDFFQQMVTLSEHTIGLIETKKCEKVLVARDESGNRLMSMCIFKRVGDSQFHLDITKSIATYFLYQDLGFTYPKRLSIRMHEEALCITGATIIYAPPLQHMLNILREHFQWIEVPRKETTDYSTFFQSPKELEEIKTHWPRDFFCVYVYRFWADDSRLPEPIPLSEKNPLKQIIDRKQQISHSYKNANEKEKEISLSERNGDPVTREGCCD